MGGIGNDQRHGTALRRTKGRMPRLLKSSRPPSAVVNAGASHRGRTLWLTSDGIVGGMSGSPVVAESGAAIGVVATGPNAPHPLLVYSLPAGLLRQFD